jgi:SAM-dependent methyltransferase
VQPFLRDFVADVLTAVDCPDPIYEFGALQVEAAQDADLRPLFAGREYVGTDFRPGPGVDRVEDLRALTLEDDTVGTAVCLETLEHCDDPMSAGRELARVVAPGGVCIVSAPLLLGIHGYPDDYFRYTPSGLESVLRDFDYVWALGVGDQAMPTSSLAVAANGRSLDLSLDRLPSLAAAQERFDRAAGQIRIGPFRLTPRELATTAGRELRRLASERARDARS